MINLSLTHLGVTLQTTLREDELETTLPKLVSAMKTATNVSNYPFNVGGVNITYPYTSTVKATTHTITTTNNGTNNN